MSALCITNFDFYECIMYHNCCFYMSALCITFLFLIWVHYVSLFFGMSALCIRNSQEDGVSNMTCRVGQGKWTLLLNADSFGWQGTKNPLTVYISWLSVREFSWALQGCTLWENQTLIHWTSIFTFLLVVTIVIPMLDQKLSILRSFLKIVWRKSRFLY